jgi:hypothetical protein
MAPERGDSLWDRSLSLWDLTLSPGQSYLKWVKLDNTQMVSAEEYARELLVMWGKPPTHLVSEALNGCEKREQEKHLGFFLWLIYFDVFYYIPGRVHLTLTQVRKPSPKIQNECRALEGIPSVKSSELPLHRQLLGKSTSYTGTHLPGPTHDISLVPRSTHWETQSQSMTGKWAGNTESTCWRSTNGTTYWTCLCFHGLFSKR